MARAFPIAAPRDLLGKARRELDHLEAAANGSLGDPDALLVADLTINTAWSLWHTTDWIGHGAPDVVRQFVTARQMKLAPRKRVEAFQVRLRRRCGELNICWALSLHWKHLELETKEARKILEEAPIVSTPAVFSLDTVDLIARPPSGVDYSMGPLGDTAADYVHGFTMHPKFNYRGKRLRLVNVFDRAHDYLDGLLQENGL